MNIEYEGLKITERAVRHGCTIDVRKRWNQSLDIVKRLKTDEDIEKELLRLELISQLAPKVINEIIPENLPKKKKFFRKFKK